MADLLGYGGAANLNKAEAERIAMAARDPVIEQITTYPWPRGGVQARRLRGGYTLLSARTGAPVARLKPLPSEDRVEILWWRRDAWGDAGPFGAALPLKEALALDLLHKSGPICNPLKSLNSTGARKCFNSKGYPARIFRRRLVQQVYSLPPSPHSGSELNLSNP